jgi:hypothetical protein
VSEDTSLLVINKGGSIPPNLIIESITLLNSTGEDLLEEFQNEYPDHYFINNDGNALNQAEAYNTCMRAALMNVSAGAPVLAPGFDVVIRENGFFLSTKVRKQGNQFHERPAGIGYFDNGFPELYLIDYTIRARAAGFKVFVSPEFLEKTFAEDSMDTLKLGTKYAISNDVKPDKFWEYLSNKSIEGDLYIK